MDQDTVPRVLIFRADAVQKDWCIHVIVDGKIAAEYVTTEEGVYECSILVKPLKPVSFARVEMYKEDGRCILLTNSIGWRGVPRGSSCHGYDL